MERPRSKKVELLSRTYDHVSHRQVKGFTNLLLAWTDGLSSVPVINAVVSSSKIICPERNDIDKRTHGAERRKEAQEKKTILAVKLIKEALNAGIIASYVLMDSWFTEVPLISAVRKLNLHVIGMVKLSQKRFYTYQEKQYTLHQLRKKIKSASRHSNILGSLQVKLKTGIKAKLVYVVNYNNRKQFLVILSTDLTLSDEEIVQTYGKRFNIEQIFNLAAAGALHMMVLADIRIITEAVLTGIKNLDNMQPVQNLYGFIYGSKTHRRIFGAQRFVQHLGAGMFMRSGKGFVHSKALRRNLKAVLAQDGGQFAVG